LCTGHVFDRSHDACGKAIFRTSYVRRYQNVFIMNFIEAMMEVVSGDNWSYKTCKAPVSVTNNKTTSKFLQTGWPSCRPTNRVKALKDFTENCTAPTLINES